MLKVKENVGSYTSVPDLQKLPVSALYATSTTGYCAYTYARKIIDNNIAPISNDIWGVVESVVPKNNTTALLSPLPESSAQARQYDKIFLTSQAHDNYPWFSGAERSSEAVPQTIILDRILETTEDPRLILRWLRATLKSHEGSRAVIISPEASTDESSRLPKDRHHFREWSASRLVQFITSAGFIIESLKTVEQTNILLIYSTEESHRQLLQSSGLPSPRNSLIITSEHADTKATGGIGSYIKEVEQTISSDERPIILVGAAQPFNQIMTSKKRASNIIDIRDILQDTYPTLHTTDWHSSSIGMYLAVSELVFLYDQIHIVEFQEYLGIGARLVQAKRAGYIPMDVRCVARCHGSQVYIDRASFNWSGMEKADVFELERLSVNLADEVSFPTQYLKDLYISTGYNIKEDNSYILRLPYSYPEVQKPDYKKVTKLIFLGKQSIMKGFPAFYSVVRDVTDRTGKLFNPNIVEVQVIAAHGDASEYGHLLEELLEERGIKLTIGPLPRHEVLSTLQRESPHSIVCLPYGGDNHPVTILEMIANRCRFIAYKNGGIPELIPANFRDIFTCPADPIEMTRTINEIAGFTNDKTALLIDTLHESAIMEQRKINEEVRQSYRRLPVLHSPMAIVVSDYTQLATVLVPIYNTDLKYVRTVINCLNQQTLKPKEVLFINDKSPADGYVEKLHELIKNHTSIPYRIIDHEINLGLAGARNTALAECTTKYLINIDSDDVVSRDFVYDYVHFMEHNTEYSACTCALESFTDQDGWNRKPLKAAYSYVGVGDCLVLGVSKNIFGHAGSCVRTEDARKIGGWDASDRSKWEDWAFFLKMTSLGMHIFNFPKVNYYYRVSPTSMVRTYANYPAELRVARNIAGLSIWESHRLYAFVNDEASHTAGTMHSIEPDTLTYRIAKRISQNINRTPVLKKGAKVFIEGSWKLLKKTRGE